MGIRIETHDSSRGTTDAVTCTITIDVTGDQDHRDATERLILAPAVEAVERVVRDNRTRLESLVEQQDTAMSDALAAAFSAVGPDQRASVASRLGVPLTTTTTGSSR